MTSYLDSHSTTDATPEMLSFNVKKKNVRYIRHAHGYRKDDILGKKD